ncbi:MAG: hypothetical protein FGM61_09475 [Sediminibacterium sp.]|nr:hypothetical protein [Sediminibacterium sp.]
MELSIIDGNFPKEDEKKIVQDIFAVKIQYHQNRLRNAAISYEAKKHSEERLQQLEAALQKLLKKIRSHADPALTIQAHLELNIFAPVTQ